MSVVTVSPAGRRSALVAVALSLSLACVPACDEPIDEDPGSQPGIPESEDPATVDPSLTRFTGFVRDYESAAPVEGALVSTSPASDLVLSRADGGYVLTRDLVGAQLYTLQASAEGYAAGAAPAFARQDGESRVDLLLIDHERALPVVFDPPVVALPPSVQRAEIGMRSRADEPLQWRVTEQPDWLVVEPASGELAALASGELEVALEPVAFAEARRDVPEGEPLWSALELRDQRDRIAVVQVLVVPASDDAVTLAVELETTTGDDGLAVLGRFVDLEVRARFESVALEGAHVELELEGPEGGLVLREGESVGATLRTDEDGELALRLDAEALGTYTLRVSLPAFPQVAGRSFSLEVVPDDACAVDNGGCGERQFNTCSLDERGFVVCADLDECAVDANGQNGCGDALFWQCTDNDGAAPDCADLDECATNNGGCDPGVSLCIDNDGAAPTCADLDECATDNGGCGDARYWQCLDQELAAPDCVALDPCATDNGGCGDALYWQCTGTAGEPPTCLDLDECAVDANGQNGCGDALFWQCTDNDGAAPTCADLDECATDNGGCGDALVVTCVEQPGAPPQCSDVLECATNNGGCHLLYEDCVDNFAAPPTCADRNECATNNGGCGDPLYITCVNNLFAPASCEDIDECAPNGNGVNACGVAAHWSCTNQLAAAPTCTDKDECAIAPDGTNGCGVAAYWSCTDRVGLAPACSDVDECATNNGGCDPGVSLCVDNDGAAPTCADKNECLVNNGGCDPLWETCINNLFAPASCTDRDECAPDPGGLNACGEAAWLLCEDQVAAAPICTDLDACEVINGADACADPATTATCVDQPFAAPTCAACAPGTVNLDLEAIDGCEYLCTSSGPEDCNHADDDCDGLVDEDFDLASSASHCGACGAVCATLPNATATACDAGKCQVVSCEHGWRDDNGLGSDGCERQATGPIVYVDSVQGSSTGSGASTDPFDTIVNALAALSAQSASDATIVVRPGSYTHVSTLLLDQPGLALVGTDRGAVIITKTLGTTAEAIRITADDVTLSTLTVGGGATGIHFTGNTISRGSVDNVTITTQRSSNPAPVVGVRITNSGGISVRHSAITDVAATVTAASGATGGAATGIEVTGASGCKLEGNTISAVRAGTGGIECGGTAPSGGQASGIRLTDSSGCLVRANHLASLDGGTGGVHSGCTSATNGGSGGLAVGLYSLRGTGHTFSHNHVDDARGGDGGRSSGSGNRGRGNSGVGAFVDQTTLATLERNTFTNLLGGDMNTSSGVVSNSGGALGVWLRQAGSATVRNMVVSSLVPGTIEPGGNLACVRVENTSPATITHLSCHDVGGTANSYGVFVTGTTNNATVRDSIVSGTATACYHNGDVQSALDVGFVIAHDCGLGTVVNATLDGRVDTDDPLFAAPELDNLRLLPTSPAIDAADPLSPFEQEPMPNGCVANLGAWGNTLLATAAPGATHCP